MLKTGSHSVRGDVVSDDLATLAGQLMPYVDAAAKAYGSAVLQKMAGGAADTTAGLGKRIFGSRSGKEELPVPLQDVVAYPADEDAVSALRLAIRKLLDADPQLRADIKAMLPSSTITVTATGNRSVAAQQNSGVIVTGDDAVIEHRTSRRDDRS